METQTPSARNDTRSRSRSAGTQGAAQDGAAGDCTRDNPRAAGAASARGAQPSGHWVTSGAGALRASTERTGDRGDGGWYEGVLRDGRAIAWRCGHSHKTRSQSYPMRPSALDCAWNELRGLAIEAGSEDAWHDARSVRLDDGRAVIDRKGA